MTLCGRSSFYGNVGSYGCCDETNETLKVMRFALRLIVVALIVGGTIGYFLPRLDPNSVENQIHFRICDTATRVNCAVDGDTIWYGAKKIRIADIADGTSANGSKAEVGSGRQKVSFQPGGDIYTAIILSIAARNILRGPRRE